jgi:hypothetical protein
MTSDTGRVLLSVLRDTVVRSARSDEQTGFTETVLPELREKQPVDDAIRSSMAVRDRKRPVNVTDSRQRDTHENRNRI